MKNILTIIFCFLTFNAMTQVDLKKHTFNSNLLSLLNPYYSSITLGYEYRPIEKFGIEFTYGHIDSDELSLGCGNYFMDEGKGSVYRLEPKYYFKTVSDRDTLLSFFASVKFYTAQNKYLSNRRLLDNYDESVEFKVSQKIKGVIPTVGINYIYNGVFFIETSLGFGRRWVESMNDYSDYDNLAESCWYGLYSDLEGNGVVAKWRLNLNFKVGVSF